MTRASNRPRAGLPLWDDEPFLEAPNRTQRQRPARAVSGRTLPNGRRDRHPLPEPVPEPVIGKARELSK